MSPTAVPAVALRGGGALPCVGLGVFRTERGETTRAAVRSALEAGYRHVDTARIYGNEADVGAAIRESGLPRSEVFVTTKLWNEDQGYDAALRAFEGALQRLGMEYVDLFLLHWPVPGKRLAAWRALETLRAAGKARAIGVSNFLVPHLTELLAAATEPPAVNQIEVHPFLQRREVRALCEARGIVVEAYSPLTKGQRLDHPTVVAIAQRRGRSPAQVLLRWGLQHHLVVLPKSTRPERIRENLALFDFTLDADDLRELDALEEDFATGWNPDGTP
jgi:diketogulonate reductase-like aldo/keto reductase